MNKKLVDTEYNFVLFSGGNDSLVTTHYITEQTELDYESVIYLDTGIGLEETKNHVKSVCEQFDWPLEIVETPKDYKEIVKEHGFPGPSSHRYMYVWLKERALAKLNRRDEYYGTRCGLYTGVRQDESQRRMGHVAEKKEGSMFNWYAPMFDWTDEEMEKYRDEYNLPENPTYGKVHMSGDCFCGAYANRDTELIDLQAHYPEMYEKLMEIEEEVKEELGEQKAISYWGHGGKNEIDLYFECDTVGEGIVCSSCGVPGEDVDKNIFDY
jgi:3'-phosphoadenosine 5'-phosphosulfate sulfotransferase (PAPS reductase)/FAD synthetase